MRTRIIHVNLLLLDANVIISLHELGLWGKVTKNNPICVPSEVIREVNYYDDESGRHYLNLREQVGITIKEMSATAEEIAILKNKLNPAERENIDLGESEALAILEKNTDMIFYTADEAAVKALVFLNIIDRTASLEMLLKKSNLPFNKVHPKDSEQRFKVYIKKAQQMRIQGIGLR